MSKYVFHCSMTQMIQIFTDLAEYPTDSQNFLCEKIDDYHYILRARPNDENVGYEGATLFSSKKYFSIKVELSSLSFAEQQIKCIGNTNRLKLLILSVGISIGIYYYVSNEEEGSWVRFILFWCLSWILFIYYTNTMREEFILSVRKTIIRKTFVRGNRRR